MINENKNEISTLIEILSIKFPTQYPTKDSIDELDSFLPAINFPKYSSSDIDSFSSIFSTQTTFKDIIEQMHFYFPLVPSVLQIISNYQQNTTDEILEIFASIIMCSYISWRAFCEYTKNFEHLQYILNCIPIVSQMKYANIIKNIYCDSLNYYLEECTSFNFNLIFPSMKLLLEKKSINILSEIQSIFYTILSKKLLMNTNSEIMNDCQIFINYLGQLTDAFPDIFQNDIAKDIIFLLTNQIENIEINSLHLFSNLYHLIEKEVTIPIFSIFPVSYYKHIISKPQLFEFPTEPKENQATTKTIDEKKLMQQKIEDQINFQLIEGTFLNGFTSDPVLKIQRKHPNGFFLNEETRKILFFIAQAAKKDEECRDIIIKDFNSFIVQKENKYHNILLYSLIYIVSNLNLNAKQAKAYWDILLTSEIFNDNFSVFNYNESDQIINQMRTEAIDSMALSGYIEIHSFLLNLAKNQLLLAETFHRLYSNDSKISKNEFLSTDFLNFFIHLFIYFKNLNINEKEQNNLEIIESTRICFLHIISQGLLISDVAIFWFSIPIFSNFFSSLILEDSLRNFILEQYKHYLLNYFHQNDKVFISGIEKLINELIQNEKSLTILIDFVKMINTVLSIRSDSIELFYELIDTIADTLIIIDYNSEESLLYFTQVLQTFLFINLLEKHYLILEEVIKKLNNENNYQNIKEIMFKLASGNNFSSSEMFPLQQARIITIMIQNISLNNEKLNKYFEIEIYPLLKNSIYNCYQAFNCGIEEFLIDKLKCLQKENPIDLVFASKILNILTLIYSVNGSMNSAQQLIEFLCPIDLKYVSSLSPYLLQMLTALFNNYSKTPNAYLSFSTKLDILNVDSNSFQNSFELAFWCFIEPYKLNNSTIQACSIIDSKSKGILISFTDNKIIINHLKKHEEMIEFNVNFPKGKWHLVRIKFIFNKQSGISRQSSQSSIDSNSVRSTSNMGRNQYESKSFNTSDYSSLSIFNTQPVSRSPIFPQLALSSSNQPLSPLKKPTLPFKFSFSPSFSNLSDFNGGLNGGFSGKIKQPNTKFLANVSVIVDGNETEIKELNMRRFSDQNISIKIGSNSELIPKGYFSCFSAFPYINNNKNNFFNWDNRTRQIFSSVNPFLTVNFKIHDGVLKAVCKPNEAVIENYSNNEIYSSLPDIFINKMKIHSLIFLFAELDFTTIDQSKVPAFADFTVEMIGAFIQCGKSAQISFYENNCTEAIAHLFSLCDPSNLNFSIYLQISALLNLIVVPELKQKLLQMIVLNFDIWGRTESEVFRLITQHWAQNLFIDYQNKMKEITSLPFLLFIMKEYYENEKILNNIYNLFIKIADLEFASQDFLNMIEYCTTNKEIKLIISYLLLLKKTLLSRKDSDSIISHNIQYISLLHDLLDLNDETIFCSVIEIILICHRKNFIKNKSFTLHHHIKIIMNKVTSGICTMNSLKTIINISNSTNQSLYPLCCLIALNQGKEAIEFLANSIKPSKLLVNSLDRLLWIVMLLINIDDFEKQKEFCFLFNSNYSKIKETCILVQIISVACGKIPDQQLNSFLCLEFSLISDHPENFQAEFVHKILKIAYKSLLFQSKQAISEWIQKVVEYSPFNDQINNISNLNESIKNNSTNKEKNVIKREEIYKKIEEIGNQKQKIAFRLCPRLDEKGNWLELSLAFQCLKLFEIYFKSSLLTYDLILCAFIFKVSPALAKTHLQRINISNYSSKIPSSLLSFLFFSGESKGIDLTSIIGSKPPSSKLSAFTFLQEFSDQIKTDVFGSEMVKMASDVFSLYDQSSKIERNFTTFSNNAIIEMKEKSSIIFEQIKNKRLMMRFENLHVWQQMWNEMSRNKGKWSSARNLASVKSHFKRSSRLIFNENSNSYCPLKMTINNEFYNDHNDASIARDIGSVKEAETIINEYRNKKKSYGIVFSTLRPSITNSFSKLYEHFSSSQISYEKYMNSIPVFKKKAILINAKGCEDGYFEVYYDAFVINKKTILFSEIRGISLRRRFHRQTAFEIFKKNGKAYFIEIPNYNNNNLMKYFLPFMSTSTINDYTEKWINYEISTFEYLLKLNEFSSRTFNDLSAYPIMPWIISDYDSEKLDLDNPNTFRDLSKPMGALNEERLKVLKSNSVITGESIPVHLYPNGYLSPLIVLSYLVRIEPFTTIHINYHSGKFESSTKIFKSIALSYKNANTLNSDFMELIPEFFTTPEFLLNKENFDLSGPENKKAHSNINKVLEDENNSPLEIQENSIIPDIAYSTEQITLENSNTKSSSTSDKSTFNHSIKSKCSDYVQLPKWAMKSSNVFIYMNRKALESNYVSMNIHKWIDLIWGFKQRGPEAEKADNTFYPYMYSDVWTRIGKEFNASVKQVETILSEVGQIPIQLFATPHPQRRSSSFKNSHPIKNEETIMFGINQIIFSSFSTIKGDDNVNSNSSISTNIRNLQKNQKQRDSFVSGLVVDSSGKLICLNIRSKSISTVYNDSIEKWTSFTTSNEYNKLCLLGNVISSNTFVCCSNSCRSFFVFKPFDKVTLKSGNARYSISHICFDGNKVVTSGGNLMSVWNIDDLSKPLFTLPTYRNEICCISISSSFDLFVAGTLDGYVQFNSIDERRSIQISEIGDIVPVLIKITPAWGFVIVYGKLKTAISDSNFLILFSANGNKIRQVELPIGERLTAIEVYKSKDGFDFAFVATESGNLYHFEVFFSKFDKPFYNAPFYINSISIMAEQNALYCTGKDNSILVVPYYNW